MRYDDKIVISAIREGGDLHKRMFVTTAKAMDVLDPVYFATAGAAKLIDTMNQRDSRIAEIIIISRR